MRPSTVKLEECIWPSDWKVLPDYEVKHRLLSGTPLNIQPGDIVLRTPHSPGVPQKIIQAGQVPANTQDTHRCWTHVALCHEDGFLLDAVPDNGVRKIAFLDFVDESPGNHFRARRILPPLAAARITKVLGFAEKRIGDDYSKVKAALYGFANLIAFDPPFPVSNQSSTHCAAFVSSMLLKGAAFSVCEGTQCSYPVPASFSLNRHFNDVDIFN